MTKFYDANGAVVYSGDCLEVLRELEDNLQKEEEPYDSNEEISKIVESINKLSQHTKNDKDKKVLS